MQTPLSFRSFQYAKCCSISASSAGVESLSKVGRGGIILINQLLSGGLAGTGLELGAGAAAGGLAAGTCAERTDARPKTRVAMREFAGFMRRIVNGAATSGKTRPV